jgi:hypothetical protein
LVVFGRSQEDEEEKCAVDALGTASAADGAGGCEEGERACLNWRIRWGARGGGGGGKRGVNTVFGGFVNTTQNDLDHVFLSRHELRVVRFIPEYRKA